MVIAEAEKELLHLLDRVVFRDAEHMLVGNHDVPDRACEEMAKGDAVMLAIGHHAENDPADHDPERAPMQKQARDADQDHADRDAFAQQCRAFGGLREGAALFPEPGAKHAAPVHGECGNEVVERQDEIEVHDVVGDGEFGPGPQEEADGGGAQRTRERDLGFEPRRGDFFGQHGPPTDDVEHDFMDPDAVIIHDSGPR